MPYFGGFRRFRELLQGSLGTGASYSDGFGQKYRIKLAEQQRLATDYGMKYLR
jgi:hypothetical protein